MRRFVLFLLMLLLLAGQVVAQTGTPPPPTSSPVSTATDAVTQTPSPVPTIPDYFAFESVEVVFPLALVFQAQLNLPKDDLVSARLTLSQEGWQTQEIDVDLAEDAAEDAGLTTINITYLVTPADAPRLFTEIDYSWRFVKTGNESGTVSGSLEFQDSRVNWNRGELLNGRFNLFAPANLLNPAINSQLETIYELIREHTGGTADRLSLVVYPQNVPLNPCDGASMTVAMTGDELACEPDALSALYEQQGYGLEQMAGLSLLEMLASRLFDQLYESPAALPQWFRYGLIRFYIPANGLTSLTASRAAVRAGNLYRDLSTVPDNPNELAAWQAQAYGMVVYSAQRIGAEAVFDLARAEAFDEAYQQAVGLSVNQAITAWGDWIFSLTAEEAYGYNIYESDIPTLEPTEPVTPISLVPSKTPTVTPTATPTATVTGILSPTPGPSLTPTHTFTPSVTPRPAGSLSLTPESGSETEVANDSGVSMLSMALIGIGVLLVLIVLVMYWREGRTRGKNDQSV